MIYKGKDNGRGATGNYNSAWTQELHTKKEGDWVEKAVRSLTMCTVLVVYCLMEIGQYSLWLDKYIYIYVCIYYIYIYIYIYIYMYIYIYIWAMGVIFNKRCRCL